MDRASEFYSEVSGFESSVAHSLNERKKVNVIIYWNSGDYADVYNVDKVTQPSAQDHSLRLFKTFQNEDFEIARFKEHDIRGWQIFLTAEDTLKNNK